MRHITSIIASFSEDSRTKTNFYLSSTSLSEKQIVKFNETKSQLALYIIADENIQLILALTDSKITH